ncbi:MAG TPA: hypothetical protein ENN72_05920 [Firmicutes bacterium]|nr:hypothetical protein [Bacillota bacterium]
MDKRIFIFSGYYGSGKTEVASNFALFLKKNHEHVALADMDVVNPYFRSRDKEILFRENGIKLIAPPSRVNSADLPVITASIGGMIDQDDYKVVLDMGGDDVGTIPLGSLRKRIQEKGRFEVFIIVNVNRPFTRDTDGIIKMAKLIEKMSELHPTAIISNTHMKELTDREMILRGAEYCSEASLRLNIPLAYITVPAFLDEPSFRESLESRFEGDVFPLELFYHTPWEEKSTP